MDRTELTLCWGTCVVYAEAATCTITDIRVKIGGGLVLLLIVNESVLCAHMLQFAMLPYHCAVEIVGMYVFYNMVQERHKTA